MGIDGKDALDVLTRLVQAGIETWIDGGWAVDALLGEPTRPHQDLDIVVHQKHVEELRGLLSREGYNEVERPDTRPWNFVLADCNGREIDVHAIVVDGEGNGWYGPAEKGVGYPAESLTGTGVINGQQVKCISAEWMVRFKTGYELRSDDYRDLIALCQRYRLPFPESFDPNVLGATQ